MTLTPTDFLALLDAMHLSQAEAARRLGLDRATVWRYAHGKQPVPQLVASVLTLWLDHYQRTGALP